MMKACNVQIKFLGFFDEEYKYKVNWENTCGVRFCMFIKRKKDLEKELAKRCFEIRED